MSFLIPYLTFNGNCGEAMKFYHSCVGGELQMQSFGESGQPVDEKNKNLIMHANIHAGGIIIMASDNMPGTPDVIFGSNMSMSVDCDDPDQQTKFFNALSEGGTITMPLQDTFWGARFGMLMDKFGIAWMFNYDKK